MNKFFSRDIPPWTLKALFTMGLLLAVAGAGIGIAVVVFAVQGHGFEKWGVGICILALVSGTWAMKRALVLRMMNSEKSKKNDSEN